MLIRIYQDKDYWSLSEWWKEHGWDAPPAVILPKLGVIVSTSDERDLAAAWLYMDNSVGVSMCEFIVSNPDNTARETVGAIKLAIEFLEDQALRNDYGVMLTTCKQEALARLLKKSGFSRTDDAMIHMVKVLRSVEDVTTKITE